MNRNWRMVPHFLLRRAGFSFGALRRLSGPESAGAARDAVRARRVASVERSRLLGELIPAEVRTLAARGERGILRGLSRCRRRIGHWREGRMPEGCSSALASAHGRYVQALLEERGALATLSARLERELLEARQALRGLFADPQVREALFLLSPDLLETMERALDRPTSPVADAAERAFERRLYAFAQRLTAKNETTSFFGPLTPGTVGAELEDFAFGPQTPSGVTQREAFVAFWAAAALGKAASRSPAIRRALAVRRIPVSGVWRTDAGEARARGPDGQELALSVDEARLFEAVDDLATVPQLAERCGLQVTEAERIVGRLERGALVRRQLEPLSTVSHPLDDVEAQLPAVAEAQAWRDCFARIRALLRQFEGAELGARRELFVQAEREFTQATSLPARREAGKTYADRTILYEDCLGDLLPLHMPGRVAADFEAEVAPVLQLGATYGQLRHEAVLALARDVLGNRSGAMSLLSFAEVLEQEIARGAMEPLDAPVRDFLGRLTSEVRAASDGRVARLPSEVLSRLVRSDAAARFASPDVMLAREPDGSLRYVLGEVHPYVFGWGSQGYFATEPEAMQAALAADLTPWGGRERMAMVLRRRRHKGLVTRAFPGTFIEVSGRADDGAERRIAVADLRVSLEDGQPVLRGPKGTLTLYVGEDDHAHLRVFAPPQVQLPPVRLGARTPRIEAGRCVMQRERWSVAPETSAGIVHARTPAQLTLGVARLADALELPRWLFAWSATETKPMCVDLESPFARSHLQRLASLGSVTLTEMLPSPDQLWLNRAQGAFTSEFRLAMVRDA